MAGLVNNAVFTASAAGAGAFGVAGAVLGYQTPAAAGAIDGTPYHYRAQSFNLSEWEIGTCVPSASATSFTRVVTASSAGGTTTVNFTAAPNVMLTLFASDITNPANNLLDLASRYTARDNLAIHGADIASAATVNLEAATGDLVDVTGTVAITAVTLSEGHERTVRFTGVLTLTNGGSLVLPGAANITTAAGDFAIFRGYAAGVVRCVSYVPAAKADARNLIGATGNLVAMTVITASGTWTKAANTKSVVVEVQGGGGSAGGTSAIASQCAATGGGGGGGYSRRRITAPGATETVTVGAGGATPTAGNNPGNNGGTSSFGSWCSATGGGGSQGGPAGGAANGLGGTPGIGSGGDLNIAGGPGTNAIAFFNSALIAGAGGGSVLGGGGGGGISSSVGIAGNNYGGGGGGTSMNGTDTARSAGAGAPGVVIVWEYA